LSVEKQVGSEMKIFILLLNLNLRMEHKEAGFS